MSIKEQYQQFTRNNAGFGFQSQEITGQLNWDGLNEADAIPALRSLQRLYRLYPDADIAAGVYESGYRSAHDVAGQPEQAFIDEVSQTFTSITGGDAGKLAQTIWLHARTVCYQVNMMAAAMLPGRPNQSEHAHFEGLPKFHEGMPSWQTLFGPGYAAQVKECESIYGAAAYFTDLMRIIDTYITATSTDIPAGLTLAERRPDLWQISLDCYTTYHELTYLEIANQVMDAKLANDFQQDTAQYLATNYYPFSLPMNLPLEKIRMYLAHFGFTLAEVYQRFQADASQVARESLLLSIEKAGMITAAAAVPTAVMYGLYADETEASLTSEAFFETKTSLLPAQVQSLVYQQLRPKEWEGLVFSSDTDDANTVTVPNSPSLQVVGDQTIGFWIYLPEVPIGSGNGQKTSILSKYYNGEFDIEMYNDGTIDGSGIVMAYRCGNAGGTNYINIIEGMTLNMWYHVVVMRNMQGTPSFSLYSKDAGGNVVQSDGVHNFSYYPIDVSSSNVTIGSENFNGILAEVRIWNRVLSDAELDNNMWRSLTGKEQGLMAYWPLNDGRGTIASDHSQFANNGTLSSDLVAKWGLITDFYFGDYEQNPALQQQLWINNQQEGVPEANLNIITVAPEIAAGSQIRYSDNSDQWQLLGRFIHCSIQLNWQFADTDWALNSIGSTVLQGSADLGNLAAIQQLVKELKQPVDAICALWHDMKTYGIGAEGPSQALFDRVFNTPKAFYNPDGLTYPAPYHPLYTPNPFYHDVILNWDYTASASKGNVNDGLIRNSLLGALKLTDTELTLILNYLHKQQLITADTLTLSVPNLSLLYRYACLSKWALLPVEQFLQVLRLMNYPALKGPQEVLEIYRWIVWLKQNGVNIYQFEYLCYGSIPAQLAKKYALPNVSEFLQQLATAAPATLFSPASLSDAGLLQSTVVSIFNALCTAGFCDTQGVILDERPITEGAVSQVLAALADSLPLFDGDAVKDKAVSFSGNNKLTTQQESDVEVQGHDLVSVITQHITKVLQGCRDAQANLVLQQLAAAYKVPAQQMAAVLSLIEKQMPSAPVFDSSLSIQVSIPYSAAINPAQLTISFWCQFTSLENKQTLYSTINNSMGLELLYLADSTFQIYLPDGSYANPEGTIEAGVWYHILLSVDTPANGSTPYTWSINGIVSKGEITGAYTPADADTTIGYIPDHGNYFGGQLLDFRLYNGFVSYEDLIILEMDHAVPESILGPLCAWWPLNSRDNNTVYDWSGNNNNATISSAGSWQWRDYGVRQLLAAANDTGRQADAYTFMQQLSLMTAWAKWFKLSADEIPLIALNPKPFNIAAMRYGFRFTLGQLRAFATYKTLHADYRLPGPSLLEYFITPGIPELKTGKLASAMGWPEDQLKLLERKFKYGDTPLAFPEDYADFNTVSGVNSLARCFEVSMAIGVNIAFFFQLRQLSGLSLITGDTATDNTHWGRYVNAADSLEQAVNARYTTEQVSTVQQPVQDKIQVLMRDVMSRLLIWELGNTLAGIETQQDLYEYLLIDVRMTNAVKMSVLKAGLNSLQLYVQRCLSNMENGVSCTLPKEWWAWMGSYREWEANREIYVYPENYVDPTLRKMQSPLYKNLVSEVKQQPASEESVTKAYLNYLDGLRDIASLEILDSYARPIPASLDLSGKGRIIDVFGRTLASPATFYHRKAVVSDPASAHITWTPWESTGLNISSEYLTPVFAFGKLFVFWVTQTSESTTKGSDTYSYIKATIYYSFQKAGSGWAPTQVLADDVIIKTYNAAGNVTDYYFTFQLNGFNPLSGYENTKPWNKVTATLLPAAQGEDEKILITLGDMVTWVNDPNTPFVAADAPETPEQRKTYTYLETLAATVLPLTGNGKVTTVVPAILLDSSLRSVQQTPLLDLSLTICYNGFLIHSYQHEVLGFLTSTGVNALAGMAPHEEAFIKSMPDNNIYHAWYDVKGTVQGTLDKAVTGPYGNNITCLNFDNNIGNQINVTIPYKLAPLYTEFTVAVWMQTSNIDLGQPQAIFDTSDTADNGKGSIVYITNRKPGMLAYEVLNFEEVYLTDFNLQNNQWYYVVLRTDDQSTNLSLYDPVSASWQLTNQVASLNTGATIPHNNLRVGYMNYGGNIDAFSGYITGLQVFNKAITDHAFFDITIGNDSANIGLGDLPAGRSSVIPVKNQQGWFFLNAGKESFMVIPTDADYGPTEPLVSVSYGAYLSVSVGAQASSPAGVPHYNFIRTSTCVVDELMEKVFAGGVGNLLQPSSQLLLEPDFNNYLPNSSRINAPVSVMDFNGAYGVYFRELFFYIPFYIAENLQLNLKFLLAKKWYEYVFDPTVPPPSKQTTEHVVAKLDAKLPSADNPVAFWSLASESGVGTMPSAKGHYNGTVTGALTPARINAIPPSWQPRTVNYFNAGNGYVSVPYDAALNTQQFSVSFRVNINEDLPESSGGTWANIISSADGSTGYKISLYKWQTNAPTFLIQVNNNGNYQLQAIYAMSLNVWYHFVICLSGTGYTVYINGADGNSYTAGKTVSAYAPNTSAVLTFGSGLTGYLANVALWNACLSQDEVNALLHHKPLLTLASLKRFWQFVPFRELEYTSLYDDLTSTSGQYLLYEYDPFDPDAIASQRPGAYAKGIFMRYISNLIDFGDNLFTQDTWESITEATMYYVLASDLLGRPPKQDATQKGRKQATYNDIVSAEDGNVPAFLIDMEAMPALPTTLPPGLISALEQRWSIFSAYFGIPENTQLLTYRKTIEDRLYKIRHGLNINGQTNNIPLFEPPINPADAAAAAGPGGAGVGSISSAAPAVPYYRFSYLIDLARNFTSEVISLGNELLAALEKQDGEYLSLLRETQSNAILGMMTQIKQDQVNQLYAEQSNLQASLANAQLEQSTYNQWIAASWNDYERNQLACLISSAILSETAAIMTLISSPMYLFPTIFGLSDGGVNFGGSFEADARFAQAEADEFRLAADILGIYGSFQRTNDQWNLQMNMATNSINGINAQLQANSIAIQSAEQDYSVNQTQITQSNAVISFLQTKFSNEQLYEWMASEVSSVYYQAYQLACGLAQMAQTAYQFELSLSDTYINTSSWSNQYRGLLAGDALMLSINQLQQAYIRQNSRSLEINRTISLARLNPAALLQLKANGTCVFKLTEYLFDCDFPGHYNRKIKSIAITIPAIVGPYQNIKATLIQTANAVITTANADAVSYLLGESKNMPTDGSIRMNWNSGQEIALSAGTSDNGMFQLNYNDERFLPFENTGAVSSWQLNMPKAANQFDFTSINDIIIELKYCATDGGTTFRNQVTGNSALQQYNGTQLLSIRQNFADAWQQFLTTQGTSIQLQRKMYPPNLNSVTVASGNSSSVILIPVLSDQSLLDDIASVTLVDNSVSPADEHDTTPVAAQNPITFTDPVPVDAGAPVKWSLSTSVSNSESNNNDNPLLMPGGNVIDAKKWVDILLIIPYSGTLTW
jgi:hypothetical protein